jgi:hypothetical protein
VSKVFIVKFTVSSNTLLARIGKVLNCHTNKIRMRKEVAIIIVLADAAGGVGGWSSLQRLLKSEVYYSFSVVVG